MNKYSVHGEYTISFDVDVIAESESDAEIIAEGINFWEAMNNSICVDPIDDGDEPTLNADGCIDNVTVELLEENIEVDDDDEDDDDADDEED